MDPLGVRSPRRQKEAETALLSTLPGRGRGTPALGRRESVHSSPDTRLGGCGPTVRKEGHNSPPNTTERAPPLGNPDFSASKDGLLLRCLSMEADAVPALRSTSSGVKLPDSAGGSGKGGRGSPNLHSQRAWKNPMSEQGGHRGGSCVSLDTARGGEGL